MKLKFILVLLIFLVRVIPIYSQNAYSPTGQNRIAAEWEPALGCLITWPPSVPHDLITELAKDTKLFLLVADEHGQIDAVNWLSKWHISPEHVKFIRAPQGIDASWVRDWGPHAVFTPDGTMKLADGKYLYATPVTGFNCNDSLHFLYMTPEKIIIPTNTDDKAPEFIGLSVDLDMVQLPFVFTGGNVMADGQETAFSTCVITNENKYGGESESKFITDANKLLGIENYNFISNFEPDGIQHIDCFMKMLDEDRLLVTRPPADHPLYQVYENIVNNELSKFNNAHGRPYEILRLDTDRYKGDRLAAYSNSLILNKTIYVPLFGIKQDSVALSQWSRAMPGYTIKGFKYNIRNEPRVSDDAIKHYGSMGWNSGDALHCRTMAMWDPQMLYLSVDRIPTYTQPAKEFLVKVIVKDYSKAGLINESLKLSWRNKGNSIWNEVRLVPGDQSDNYTASIPGAKTGATIEYFVSAKDKSGRSETMPRTAPAGLYVFSVL